MIPITLTVGPLAGASANFFAVSATPTSGTPLTLAHTTPATPRRVLLTYGNEGSARTLVLTGTNADGNSIQETLAVPSGAGGTVATSQDFATLVSAMPLGGGWTAAMTLGTNVVASSPWKIINPVAWGPTEVAWNGVATGTVNWSIEITLDNPNNNANVMGSQALGNYPSVPNVITPITALTSQAASANGVYNDPFYAWRLTVNSGTGSVQVTALEAGMQ